MIWVRALPTAAALAILWFALSGRTDPLRVSLGVFSILASLALAMRLGAEETERRSLMRIPQFFGYWLWLGGEIAKANWAVARIVLSPKMNLSPRMVRTAYRPGTALGRATYANSVTLTPGTVSVDLGHDGVIIHALCEEFVDMGAFAAIADGSARASGEAGGATMKGGGAAHDD